jgi:hypothetical protein
VTGPDVGPACAAVQAEEDCQQYQQNGGDEAGGGHTRTWGRMLLEHADLPVWEVSAAGEECKLTLGQVCP